MLRFATVALAGLSLAAQDPRELIKKSLERDKQYFDLAQQYTYLETITEQVGKNGASKPKVEVIEIMNLYGEPYRRGSYKKGPPPPPAEEKREEQKHDKPLAGSARGTAARGQRGRPPTRASP